MCGRIRRKMLYFIWRRFSPFVAVIFATSSDNFCRQPPKSARGGGRKLGFVETKSGVEYIRWRTINGYLRGFGFSQDVAKDDFIPENLRTPWR